MDRVEILHISKDVRTIVLDHSVWDEAKPVRVNKYWSGVDAPGERSFEARLLWSDTALYVRFDAEQHEPLIVSGNPDTSKKVFGLWDRDVCEIFIAPDRSMPDKYFEFEIAPTGEWVDLAIEVTPSERLTHRDYASGMEAAVRVIPGKVIEIIKIPFEALGRKPRAGDIWLGNLFRCIGAGPTRGYLAWKPTLTSAPSFHVPKAFGEFEFVIRPS